jgi:hypothetical protein
MIAANTTMRGCEIKGLKLADVDLLQREIPIERASTKADAGCRRILLNNLATRGFAKILEHARLLGVNLLEFVSFQNSFVSGFVT